MNEDDKMCRRIFAALILGGSMPREQSGFSYTRGDMETLTDQAIDGAEMLLKKLKEKEAHGQG